MKACNYSIYDMVYTDDVEPFGTMLEYACEDIPHRISTGYPPQCVGEFMGIRCAVGRWHD